MPINLDEHAVFIDRLQMDMVPLSVAKQAVEEIYADTETRVEEAMNLIQTSLVEINKRISTDD